MKRRDGRASIARLGIGMSALLVLASTFSTDPLDPRAPLRMLWGIAVTGTAIVVGIIMGAEFAKRGMKRMLEGIDDEPTEDRRS